MKRHFQKTLFIERLETRQVLSNVAFDAMIPEGEGDMVADFQLLDVNPTSPTFNQNVSPRDYLGQVSAWYFGHAT